MKGVLIFSQLTDVLFIHADSDFKDHITCQARKAGLIEEHDVEAALDPNVVVQMFSPLVASQRFMTGQLHNPYSSLVTAEGFCFVFEQFAEVICIAINGDGTESEEYLHRKLRVLHRILTLLYGPVVEEVRPERMLERESRWKFVSKLLDKWCELYQEEQCFLTEAVEKLQINNLLSGHCVELLEAALGAMRTAGDKQVMHVMLLAQCKLLSLYSGRNASELQSADILLLILLSQTLVPMQGSSQQSSRSQSVSLSTRPCRPTNLRSGISLNIRHLITSAAGDVYESDSDNANVSDAEFFSSNSTPRASPEKKNDDDPINIPVVASSAYPTMSLSTTVPKTAAEKPPDVHAEAESPPRSAGSTPSNETESSQQNVDVVSLPWYHRLVVYVHTPPCRYQPHVVHFVKIMPAITLVIISEVGGARYSSYLYNSLHIIRTLLLPGQIPEWQGSQAQEQIDGNIKKIVDLGKKMKGAKNIEKLVNDIQDKWEIGKKNGFVSFVDSKDNTEISARLESSLSGLCELIKHMFRALYIKPSHVSPDMEAALQDVLIRLQEHVQHKLEDYSDYLLVKAERNTTITSYLDDFAGLVHFIYVDRSRDQMVAPSINITQDTQDGQTVTSQFVKDQVWKMVEWFRNKLQSGYTSMTARRGDFVYTYLLWFEDGTGGQVDFVHDFQGALDGSMPGCLTGNFYRSVVQQCLTTSSQRAAYCYELTCMHIGLVPSQQIVSQCKRLASKLWETSGDANTPISLL